MKIVVIGGTGLIGSKVVAKLRGSGHEVIAASPAGGINTITGEGLAEALSNTDIVVDLANSPSFEDDAVLQFFQTAGRNLLAAEINAGVKHHLALSIVGVDLMQESGYMRAKKVQEDLVRKSGVPYTIIRSTQFFEFLAGIANQAMEGDIVHISDVQFQPIAAEDVASFVSAAALKAPINGVTEIAGPERFTMPELVTRYLQDMSDPRKVVPNSKSTYYGASIGAASLVPAGKAQLGTINFEAWMAGQLQHA
ncbi:SDR family oxidoreductase [Flavitalea sp. BT771]|uniref:SDR family oxidoreductase n=1 Tax=Flavitalea sp. BT771 TaxID=3063329 RepID=UPI0026E29801|nr:SDR family oxidoreductase [Flavitalea sp. BT771]MDO6435630.1 SDR family oxidoreductase [Flavitalea sp. BT771]MDV6224530.1 SDR family oxidoreductase [Flavitalea sp. BT771]